MCQGKRSTGSCLTTSNITNKSFRNRTTNVPVPNTPTQTTRCGGTVYITRSTTSTSTVHTPGYTFQTASSIHLHMSDSLAPSTSASTFRSVNTRPPTQFRESTSDILPRLTPTGLLTATQSDDLTHNTSATCVNILRTNDHLRSDFLTRPHAADSDVRVHAHKSDSLASHFAF
jgi:hypothetical protein